MIMKLTNGRVGRQGFADCTSRILAENHQRKTHCHVLQQLDMGIIYIQNCVKFA